MAQGWPCQRASISIHGFKEQLVSLACFTDPVSEEFCFRSLCKVILRAASTNG